MAGFNGAGKPVPGATVGIDELMIRKLVEAFYERVRADPALGPIFKASVANWTIHLDTMVDFWSAVALTTGTYKGKPIAAHLPLALKNEHFGRWLSLFDQTARDVCPPMAAALFVARAEKIAASIRNGVTSANPPDSSTAMTEGVGPDTSLAKTPSDERRTDAMHEALINKFSASDPYSPSSTPKTASPCKR